MYAAFMNELRSRERLRDNKPQEGLLESLERCIDAVNQEKDSTDTAEIHLMGKVEGK